MCQITIIIQLVLLIEKSQQTFYTTERTNQPTNKTHLTTVPSAGGRPKFYSKVNSVISAVRSVTYNHTLIPSVVAYTALMGTDIALNAKQIRLFHYPGACIVDVDVESAL